MFHRRLCRRRIAQATFAAAWVWFLSVSTWGVARAAEPIAQPAGGGEPAQPGLLFEDKVEAILKANCVECHGQKARKAELDLRTPKGLLEGGESGPVVVAGEPEESLLYEMVGAALMPPEGRNSLTQDEVEAIRLWIKAGARFSSKTPAAGSAAEPAVTDHDVIPILLLRCTVCHGLRRREGELDLRTKASMLKGGKSGPAIVPGKPEESLIVKRIQAEEMPPRRRLVEAGVKTVDPGEIDLLRQWIAAGAPEASQQSPGAESDPEASFSEADRQFWAFQPPAPVAIPAVARQDQVRNPIDAFILAKLREKGLGLSPEASRPTLVRRATLDLTGLPPEPAELEAFVSDDDPAAYEKLVNRLLASPRYAERWGRHWLDVAGYADSEGKTEQDLPRSNAYRYRDYVIRSFAADKPYDRFLLEQIAGDELADYENQREFHPATYDNLVATGFLRMAPDPTWSSINAFVPDRLEVIGDAIDVLSSGVLGLTLKCARCHSHKFDPIPQRDYYRLSATLKGAYDEHDWMIPNHSGNPELTQGDWAPRNLPYVPAEERHAWEVHEKKLTAQIDALRAERDVKTAQARQKQFEARLLALPAVLHDDVRKAVAINAEQRDAVQRYLVEKFEKTLRPDDEELKRVDESYRTAAEEIQKGIAALEKQRLPEPLIRALWDRGEPSPTFVLRRGNYLTPGSWVEPGAVSLLALRVPFEVRPPWPGANKTGRRLALAKWITHPDHPLTARVMVNRIWKHHFDEGLVRSLGNFGRSGTPPTHPELLDWLAREFIRRGWSIKDMHRLMITSSTYRQTSALEPTRERLDFDNALLSRYPLKRLEAESLRDTILFVSGRLDTTPFGPPDPVEVHEDGLVTSVGTEKGWRRSIYVRQRRRDILTILESFDLPPMAPNCLGRPSSTVAPQALHLMNDLTIHESAQSLAERVLREAGDQPAAQIDRLYLIVLSRLPTAEEKLLALDTLAQLTGHWTNHAQPSQAARLTPAERALANVCHALINSAEFIYVD